MKSELTDEQAKELVQGLYKSFITPKFILKKLVSIRKIDDIKFFWRAGFKVLGHLTDFKS
ncbi:MAG TPA: B12-binding domain-containing radical SAM protein, partial [Candidatus Nanoarchaeia archaeon]|nr:B12-binding domain-containing radical SAM protein [Candidatus Nanoarchaeia archaeon]